MNDSLILQSTLTIIGWIVVYILAFRKNTRIKKKDITINYLIEAWRKLEKASNRVDDKYLHEIETAIADIQLFGTRKQIELAQQFSEKFAKERQGSTLELLTLLREDLRKELNLEKAPKKFRFLRIIKDLSQQNKLLIDDRILFLRNRRQHRNTKEHDRKNTKK